MEKKCRAIRPANPLFLQKNSTLFEKFPDFQFVGRLLLKCYAHLESSASIVKCCLKKPPAVNKL